MSFFTSTQRTNNINVTTNTFTSLVVAAGVDSSNLIAYSTDGGKTWTKTGSKASGGVFANQSNMQGVATNGTLWVAVGNAGTTSGASTRQAGYSYDGKNWTAFDIDTTNHPTNLAGITWNGNVFVTGSATHMYYSYDGITWTISLFTPFSTQSQAFAWITIDTGAYVNNGFWLCGGIGTQSMAYSNDGISWNGLGSNSPFGTSGNCYAIATDGNGLVVVGGHGNSITMAYATFTPNIYLDPPTNSIANGFFDPSSITSGSWTTITSPFGTSGNVYAISYNGQIWLAGGQFSGVNMAYSIDGKIWNTLTSPFGNNANSVCSGITWTGTYWVAVGSDNTSSQTISVAYSTNPLGTWTTDSGSMVFSGQAWAVSSGSNIAPIRNDGVYGSGGKIGIQFQKGAQNTMNLLSGDNQVAIVGEKGYKKIMIDEQYGSFIKSPFCIVTGTTASSINFYYSFDGISYSSTNTTNLNATPSCIAWNGKIWVCTIFGSVTNNLAYSYDGITWTGLGILLHSGQFVIWTGTMFITAANGSKFVISYDGINWITQTSAGLPSGGTYTLAYNNNILVAGGNNTNSLAYSYDGLTWISGPNTFSVTCNDIIWNGTIFVGIGSGTNRFAWSKDGINWTGLGNIIFSTTGYCLAWSGKYFVAGGSGTNTLAYSLDGINWTALGATIITGLVQGVAWTGTRFVITGEALSGGNQIAYTTGTDPSSTGNWTTIGSFFNGTTGYSVYGGYWKWDGNVTNPSIDFRTSGKNTSGITATTNGVALSGVNPTTGVQQTLMSINTQSCSITSKLIAQSAASIAGTATFSGATNAILSTGSGAIDFSGNSGAFKTTTGAITLGGNASLITIGSGSTPSTHIAMVSGATGNIDFSNSSGTFKTSTGTTTIGGATTFTSTIQFGLGGYTFSSFQFGTGVFSSPNLPPISQTSITIIFGVAFTSVPYIMVTNQSASGNNATNYCFPTVRDASTSQFTLMLTNVHPSVTTTGSISVTWMAFGN